jgi:hypothetical protein
MISDFTLYSGATWKWTDTFTDYPASVNDCVLYLRNGINSPHEITPTKDGDSFDFDVDSGLSKQIGFGSFQAQYLFTHSDGTVAVVETALEIKPLLNNPQDVRTEDRKILDLLKEARLKIAGRDYINISINGKSTTFKTLEEIEAAIVKYEKKVGLRNTPKIISRFV